MRAMVVVLGLLVLAGLVGIHQTVVTTRRVAEDTREVCGLVSQQCTPCQSACTPCDPYAGAVVPAQ